MYRFDLNASRKPLLPIMLYRKSIYSPHFSTHISFSFLKWLLYSASRNAMNCVFKLIRTVCAVRLEWRVRLVIVKSRRKKTHINKARERESEKESERRSSSTEVKSLAIYPKYWKSVRFIGKLKQRVLFVRFINFWL